MQVVLLWLEVCPQLAKKTGKGTKPGGVPAGAGTGTDSKGQHDMCAQSGFFFPDKQVIHFCDSKLYHRKMASLTNGFNGSTSRISPTVCKFFKVQCAMEKGGKIPQYEYLQNVSFFQTDLHCKLIF